MKIKNISNENLIINKTFLKPNDILEVEKIKNFNNIKNKIQVLNENTAKEQTLKNTINDRISTKNKINVQTLNLDNDIKINSEFDDLKNKYINICSQYNREDIIILLKQATSKETLIYIFINYIIPLYKEG